MANIPSPGLLRRADRDKLWLLKHFVLPIAVRPYEHPEDFWFGLEDLWSNGNEISWKFMKLWWCYTLNTYCPVLLVALTTHIGARFMRPDIIGLLDFLDIRTFSGIMVYGGLVLAAIVGIIFVVEQLRNAKKR